jgi:hypothetical protein
MDYPRIPIGRDEALTLTGRMPKRRAAQTDDQFECAKASAAIRMRKDWTLRAFRQNGVRGNIYDRAEIDRKKPTMYQQLPEAA